MKALTVGSATLLADVACGAVTLPDDPRPSETYAAAELKAWTAKLGEKDVAAEIARDDSLGEDGFRLRVADGRLTVSGGKRGVLYGVYEALERFGGIRWLSLSTTVVPEKGGFKLPASLDEVQKPAFELRQPLWYDAMKNPDLAARLKLNSSQLQERHGGCSHLFDTVLRNCHTFLRLISPEEYFGAHPEYFSEVNGKRRKEYSQLCLTNPDVLRIVTEKVIERIEANPLRARHALHAAGACEGRRLHGGCGQVVDRLQLRPSRSQGRVRHRRLRLVRRALLAHRPRRVLLVPALRPHDRDRRRPSRRGPVKGFNDHGAFLDYSGRRAIPRRADDAVSDGKRLGRAVL